MVKLVFALLADAATVREGLLNLLGAGVNILRKQAFPAPLGLPLVVLLEVPLDNSTPHELEVRISGTTAALPLLRLRFGSQATPTEMADLPAYLPVVLPTAEVPLPEAGRYEAVVTLDGVEAARVKFQATLASDAELAQPFVNDPSLMSPA